MVRGNSEFCVSLEASFHWLMGSSGSSHEHEHEQSYQNYGGYLGGRFFETPSVQIHVGPLGSLHSERNLYSSAEVYSTVTVLRMARAPDQR
jgi:hypothetical protein